MMVTDRVREAVGSASEQAADSVDKVQEKAKESAGSVGSSVSKVVPSAELGDALGRLAQTLVNRASSAVLDRITSLSGRLTQVADGGGGGLIGALTGGGQGRTKNMLRLVKGGLTSGLTGSVGQLKDRMTDLAGAVTGGKDEGKTSALKVTNIVEDIDIGLPVELVYDQWTRFTDFPTFMKKVENVEQVSDEKLRWKANVLWSHREWESTIVEQVPDQRIVWRSEGQKGYVDGTVTFHELAPDLTRVSLVLEYHPRGFVEQTGNIWRAPGRRARLELKHFRRHMMTYAVLHADEVEGWRGEIQDGQVVDGEGPAEGEEAESEKSDQGRKNTENNENRENTENPENDESEPEKEPTGGRRGGDR